jgi:hypothetical protein
VCHLFSFTPKKDFCPHDKIWYTKMPCKKSRFIEKKKNIGRGTGITRLNKVLVTIAKVMETIGHRTMDAFKKHNCEKKSFQSELFKEFSQGI